MLSFGNGWNSLEPDDDVARKPLHTFRHHALRLVDIQDSTFSLIVIQALDGTICADGRPMGEDGTALSG